MNVRTATAVDLEPIRGVFYRSALRWDDDRAWLLAHPHHLLWAGDGLAEGRVCVAEVDGRIAGFATWAPATGAAELVDLFVDPPAMRLGVGRALVADVVDRVRGAGAAALEVTGNPNALGFYTGVGFVAIGEAATERIVAPRLRLAL